MSSDFASKGSFNASADDGKLSWTFFLDSANVHGPLLSYPPEHFTRSVKWCVVMHAAMPRVAMC